MCSVLAFLFLLYTAQARFEVGLIKGISGYVYNETQKRQSATVTLSCRYFVSCVRAGKLTRQQSVQYSNNNRQKGHIDIKVTEDVIAHKGDKLNSE